MTLLWHISCCEIPVWRYVWLAQSIRVKNYDNESSKMTHLNFPKSEKWLKSVVQNYQKRLVNFVVSEREKERKEETETETEEEKKRMRELNPYKEVCSF